MENFVEIYLAYKDKGHTDGEISKLMFIGRSTLHKLKEENGLLHKMRHVKNGSGITEEQFSKAAEIGINRTRVLVRVRENGWDIERAITTPLIPRGERSKLKRG